MVLLTAGTGPADISECAASGKAEGLFSHFAEHQKPRGTLLQTENGGDMFLNRTLFINPYSRSTLCQAQPLHWGLSQQQGLSVASQGFKHNRKLEYNNIRSSALKIHPPTFPFAWKAWESFNSWAEIRGLHFHTEGPQWGFLLVS